MKAGVIALIEINKFGKKDLISKMKRLLDAYEKDIRGSGKTDNKNPFDITEELRGYSRGSLIEEIARLRLVLVKRNMEKLKASKTFKNKTQHNEVKTNKRGVKNGKEKIRP